MKKIVLVLGLVTGMVANAQSAWISGNDKVYKVTRLNLDSVEVKHMVFGEVQSIDTMLLSDFITMTGGYSTISGNLNNPNPVPPQITENKHEHKHELNQSTINTVYFGGTALLVYGIYKLLMWSGSSSSTHTPSYSGTCNAIAASTGQRCKRQASSGSAYCWQHQ